MGSGQDASLCCCNVSEGGLVWVRRPNGSWWPGRVLRRDELPAKCVAPPRSGTPIRLLGREDGTLDWYNLTKSSRVKSFRCGEFDEFIDKAMASAVRPKKSSTSTGKYIRREEAILHALEIEKTYFLAGKQNGLDMNGSFKTVASDLPKKAKKIHELDKQPSHAGRKVDTPEENSTEEVSQSLVSHGQMNKLTATDKKLTGKKRRKTPNDSEGNEGTTRMRDLQDIGLGVASKRKPNNVLVETDMSTELPFPNGASHGQLNIYSGFSSLSSDKSIRNSFSSLRRKRSNVAQVHDNVRKKNRRNSVSKMCEGLKVVDPSYCHSDCVFSEQPCLEDANTDRSRESLPASRKTDISYGIVISPHCSGTSSETVMDACQNNRDMDSSNFGSEVKDCERTTMLEFIDDDCSDGLIDIPLITGDIHREDDPIMFMHSPTKDLRPDATEKQNKACGRGDLVCHFTEELGESSFTGSSRQFNNIRKRTEKKTLEQQLNGKKNQNKLRLGKNANLESYINRAEKSDCSLKKTIQEEFAGLDDKNDGNSFGESLTSGVGGHLVKDGSISEIHDKRQGQIPELSHFSSECGLSQSHLRDEDTSPKIQKPIATLPIHQQFLHGKVSFLACSKYKVLKKLKVKGLSSHLFDVEVTVKSSYRGIRVPLISLESKLSSKEIVGHPVPIEIVKDGVTDTLFIKKTENSLKNGDNVIRKSLPRRKRGYIDVSSLKRKYSKNQKPKLSPRKIRRLSSINVDHRQKSEERKPVVEKMAGPAIACVPLRVVFSRITEALSSTTRPTSAG